MPNWDLDMELKVPVLDRTPSTRERREEKRLDETIADDTKCRSTQHDVQKHARKASYLQYT